MNLFRSQGKEAIITRIIAGMMAVVLVAAVVLICLMASYTRAVTTIYPDSGGGTITGDSDTSNIDTTSSDAASSDITGNLSSNSISDTNKKPISSTTSTATSSKNNAVSSGSNASSEKPKRTDWNVMKNYAVSLYQNMINDFFPKEKEYAILYTPKNPDDKEFSYAWPYLQMFSTAIDMAKYGFDPNARADADRIYAGLEKYKSNTSVVGLAYQSYPVALGGGAIFSDDNIWIGMELLDYYELTKKTEALDKAKKVFTYVASQWNYKYGGLMWQGGDMISTCSTAPFSIFASRLYQFTKENKYLDWSKKAYDWCNKMVRDTDYTYFDAFYPSKQSVDKTKWTYNTGMMISAGVKLYQITGQSVYKENAQKSAEGALKVFNPSHEEGYDLYPNTPWFNMLLLQGYTDLYQLDPNDKYIITFENVLNTAWKEARDTKGYIYPDWSGGLILDKYKYVYLLDQASVTEAYINMAVWLKSNPK